MKINVNGEEKNIDLDQENALLSTALDSMGYKPNTIVVELNNSDKSLWANSPFCSHFRDLELLSVFSFIDLDN